MAEFGDRVHEALDSLAVAGFDEVAGRTPVDVTEQAMELVRETRRTAAGAATTVDHRTASTT